MRQYIGGVIAKRKSCPRFAYSYRNRLLIWLECAETEIGSLHNNDKIKVQKTIDRQYPRLKYNYCVHFDPPLFSLISTFEGVAGLCGLFSVCVQRKLAPISHIHRCTIAHTIVRTVPACLLRQLSGFESRHLSKRQNGRHKQKIGQHTLARQKIYKKISQNPPHLQLPAVD